MGKIQPWKGPGAEMWHSPVESTYWVFVIFLYWDLGLVRLGVSEQTPPVINGIRGGVGEGRGVYPLGPTSTS